MDDRSTVDAPRRPRGARGGPPRPGVVVVWSGGAPSLTAIPVLAAPLLLGRNTVPHEDLRMSRRHAEVMRKDGDWLVRDLDSRNGTFVDGQPLTGERVLESPRTLRVGSTLLTFREDLRAVEGGPPTVDEGVVIGPRLRAAWHAIARESKGAVLHVTGETGSGKELAARRFHAAGGGPFVAINCASIPSTLAERLLFGAKKGAYSDATEAEGYLQSADGGTLFLDELAELPLELQAKLLRVVETREVVPLGATRGRKIDLRICSATHRDLRALVEEGKFRRDLYHRLGQPAVELPPLRSVPEEIGWIADELLRGVEPRPGVDATFVEEAMLRPWPGNVRELGVAISSTVRAAQAAGERVLDGRHLPENAGRAASVEKSVGEGRRKNPGKQALLDALEASDGNVTAAARRLGTSRTQMRRWMAQHGVERED